MVRYSYDRLPSSCCGKYEKGNGKELGQCDAFALQGVQGCGDLLINWYMKRTKEEDDEHNTEYYSKLTLVGKVFDLLARKFSIHILYPLKVLAILLTVALILLISKKQNARVNSAKTELSPRYHQ